MVGSADPVGGLVGSGVTTYGLGGSVEETGALGEMDGTLVPPLGSST